jgi:hypothetical protein
MAIALRTAPAWKQPKRATVLQISEGVGPIWDGKEYPRLDPAIYLIRVQSIQGPQWLRCFSRWSVRLECHLMHELGEVRGFFNLGNNPSGQHVGRASRYWRAWTLANEAPPRKGEQMAPHVFLDKMFRVQVEDSRKDSEGGVKTDGRDLLRAHSDTSLGGGQE